jgi:hypothetical protein
MKQNLQPLRDANAKQYYIFQEKIKNYLLETNINKQKQSSTDNLNLFGVILAFTTKIKYNEAFKTSFLLSALMYLDLRTGRVERYLINSSNPLANEKGIDYKDDLFFTWNNEKYKVFHDFEHSLLGDLTSLTQLGDGKINAKFYCTFMAELLRDYFRFYSSYNDGNIASLRKITAPVIKPQFENNKTPIPYLKEGAAAATQQPNQSYKYEQEEVLTKIKVKKPSFGTGVLNVVEDQLVTQSLDYKNKDFEAFEAHRFFTNQFNRVAGLYQVIVAGNKTFLPETDSKLNKGIILAPKQFKNKMIDTWFDQSNIKLVYTNRGELSQVCKDFTRTLSVKTINTGQDVTVRIKTFNYNVVKKLTELESFGLRPLRPLREPHKN